MIPSILWGDWFENYVKAVAGLLRSATRHFVSEMSLVRKEAGERKTIEATH